MSLTYYNVPQGSEEVNSTQTFLKHRYVNFRSFFEMSNSISYGTGSIMTADTYVFACQLRNFETR